MTKFCYVPKNFAPATMALIEKGNSIINEYKAQGFDMTVRQLYYQLVARDIIENSQKSYKRIQSIVSNARLAGLIDWDAIVDRTRTLRENPKWASPSNVLYSVAHYYLEDRWENQLWRPEVWVEKDALVGVLTATCTEYDVPLFSCRGYASQSSMHAAGSKRVRKHNRANQKVMIIHLGDHDPSGVDMTRDIFDRLDLFSLGGEQEVNRIALNMNQIDAYNPPPNPAKLSDSRARGYISKYGSQSWELDALEPTVLAGLIKKTITGLIIQDAWDETEKRIQDHRVTLEGIADNYDTIRTMLETQEL